LSKRYLLLIISGRGETGGEMRQKREPNAPGLMGQRAGRVSNGRGFALFPFIGASYKTLT
jgi:hypothetical protein